MGSKPFDYLLLKVAMRCNIDCTYCYWFRDQSVYTKPKLLTQEVEDQLIVRLAAHIQNFDLDDFYILLHGGEPLLFGKKRFERFCTRVASLSVSSDCQLHLSMTTNGILIDDEWLELFKRFKIDITISVDGPPEIHDRFRVDFKGNGTSDRVEKSIEALKAQQITPGVLAVCDPESDPESVIKYLSERLKINKFDVLVPDATHEDNPKHIDSYFVRLFDAWFDQYHSEGVDIRYLRSMVKGLLGGVSKVESIGYGPINTVCMLTDGSLEPLDVIRITGNEATKTDLNIFEHGFEDLKSNPLWREIYEASMRPCDICLRCEYAQACGGGFLPHRFSKHRGYDNPSAYCEDLKKIFAHVWSRIAPEVRIETTTGEAGLPLA